jgi:hypothetical protein
MAIPSTFTYDLDTQIGEVRLLTNDKYVNEPIFYDEEITTFLRLEGFSTYKAAAKCLETIAADEVMVQKVIKLLALSTDGARVAAELRANASALRAQANEDPTGAGEIDIAEWVVDDFTRRERIINELERLG